MAVTLLPMTGRTWLSTVLVAPTMAGAMQLVVTPNIGGGGGDHDRRVTTGRNRSSA